MKVENYITHIDNPADEPYLKSTLFDVNMRLFNNNPTYRRIVQGCCNYLAKLASTTMEGYKKPHGMSGANIGIPFNIIAIVKNRNRATERVDVMINPYIVDRSAEITLAMSNCGSIRLPEPVPVFRNNEVTVEWYDINGVLNTATFTREEGAFTIQHEVDHNNGILITDRQREDALKYEKFNTSKRIDNCLI